MSIGNIQTGTYTSISSSTNICPSDGKLIGIFVGTASSTPTITVYDDAATGTTTKIVDTFTPVSATYYPMPFTFNKGCYVVIGGTVKCTTAHVPG